MSEIIERAARAAYEKFNENLIGCCEPSWDDTSPCFKARMLDAQRAAIETLREPTEAMWKAEQPIWSLGRPMWDWWRSMIDAALR